VIKNRTDSGAWGDPLKGRVSRVIYAPQHFLTWNPGTAAGAYANSVSPNDPIYQRAGQVADALFSGQAPDNTNGATHFYRPPDMPLRAARRLNKPCRSRQSKLKWSNKDDDPDFDAALKICCWWRQTPVAEALVRGLRDVGPSSTPQRSAPRRPITASAA
jgi:hypothetical protein